MTTCVYLFRHANTHIRVTRCNAPMHITIIQRTRMNIVYRYLSSPQLVAVVSWYKLEPPILHVGLTWQWLES